MRSVARVVAMTLVGLAACIDSTAPSKSGGLLLVMPASPALDSGHVVLAGPTTETVTVPPWATVTIDKLDPGAYAVGLEGFSGGGAANFVQISGVTVVAGQNAAPAVPGFPQFRTAILSIPAYTVDGRFPLVFSKVLLAKSYFVQRSASPTFTTSLDTSIAATDTSVQVSIPVTGPYYVRVLAVDPYSTRGQPSVAQSITTLTAVTVSPATASITAGAPQKFDAVAKDAQNNPISGITFFWASSNQNVALVDQAGLATGVAGGTATISALGLGVPGSAALTVSGAGAATRLAFVGQPTTGAAGAAINPAVGVAIVDAAGNTVTTATDPVRVSILSGPGQLLGTLTVNAVAGVASFSDLNINQAASGYSLLATASSGALSPPTSASFNITPAAAAALSFVVQPSGVEPQAVIAPAVGVVVQDQFGNTVTAASDPVTIAIGTNSGGGTLSGTATQPAASGVATFNDLAISASGNGYTLRATATGLT